jgi:Arc-like DNA binding domain
MDHEVRITLRLPTDLHAWLVAQAKSARRSLNSEIVHRLETGHGTLVVDDDSPQGESSIPAPLRGKPDSSPA